MPMSRQLFAFILGVSALCLVRGALYVNQPVSSSTCYGGQPCTVSWLDDGEQPLLAQIGACYVGLYVGDGVLVQQIAPVNVATAHSLQFTPDPSAGPDSSRYYINFTAISTVTANGSHYVEYSADFTLSSMSGSLASPVASDTSTLAVPASVTSPASDTVSGTSTVRNSAASSAASSVASSSTPLQSSSSERSVASTGMTTSRVASTSATVSSSAPSSSKSSAARPLRVCPATVSVMLALGVLLPWLCLL